MSAILLFMPPEVATLLIMLSGVAMILGARALAGTLFVSAVALLLLPVVLAPLFDALPSWLLIGLIVMLGLSMVRLAFNLLIGKRSTDHMVGILAADVVRASVVGGSRAIGWIIRAIWRRI